jgi:flagellar protein FliL
MSEKDKDPKGAKEAESSSKEVMEVEGEGEGQSPTKGKRKLLIIIAVVAVLALVGAGVMFSGILGGKKGEEKDTEPTEEQSAEAGDPNAPAAGPAKPVYYELPEFLVNLTSTTNKPSFLKMSVTLELRDAKAVEVVEANKPRIMDAFNTYLREVRAQDMAGSAGIFRLRGELMARINRTVEEGLVKDILFSEIIIQ